MHVEQVIPNLPHQHSSSLQLLILNPQLWVYPVKSLQGTSLSSAHLFRDGFKHDRRFMLLKVHHDDPSSPSEQRLENMHIGAGFPEMALFTAVLNLDKEILHVEYKPPDGTADSIEVPLSPNVKGLSKVPVVMHKSPTTGYDMGSQYNTWFSKQFGFSVIFTYLSDTDRRPVLGNVSPTAAAKGLSIDPPSSPSKYTTLLSDFISNKYIGPIALLSTSYLLLLAATHFLKGSPFHDFLPLHFSPSGTPTLNVTPASIFLTSTSALALLGFLLSLTTSTFTSKDPGITFADVAPYLIVTTASLASTSSLLPAGQEMDVRKFRPNIILADAEAPWAEDFWAQLTINSSISLVLTQNCARCASINVDFATGKPGTAESGSILKKLMKDRRVDKGTKFSPVFGRYGFVSGKGDGKLVRVGDEVRVTRRNEERTTFGESILLWRCMSFCGEMY